MKILTTIIWIAFILAIVLLLNDSRLAGFGIFGLIYGFAIYQMSKDSYLTVEEKVFCIFLIITLSIVGICLAQLYASSKMKKRFKLNIQIGSVQPAK